MRISISEYGFLYISRLCLISIICAFIGSIIGLFGFILFLISFFMLLSSVYLFRDPKISFKVHVKCVSPTDGVLLSKEIILHKNIKHLCLKINSRFSDKYAKYSPVSGVIKKISYFDKKAKEYSDSVLIEIENQDIGIVTLIFKPTNILQHITKVNVEVYEGMVVEKSQIIAFVSFGCLVSIMFNYGQVGNLDFEKNQILYGGTYCLIV